MRKKCLGLYEWLREREVTHEVIGALPQDGLNLVARVVHDDEVTIDHTEVLVVLEMVSISRDLVADDRQESPHEAHHPFVRFFNLEGQRCSVSLHIYPPHEDVRPCEYGMAELLRELPLPPVVHEPLEEQSFGSPDGIYVVFEERREVPFKPDVERPPLELAPHQTSHVVDVNARELDDDAEERNRHHDS